jgi:fatty acid desaturase
MLLDARSRQMLSRREHMLALGETALAIAFWVGIALLIGPWAFLFAFFLPLLVANVIIMSLILTNHSLSPHTEVNDPLINSLSVTGPRWIEWVTLGFGFHVEHHLFPAMSARHARKLRDVLRRDFPDHYQSTPWPKALRALYRSGRIYETPTTLVDPPTGRRWQTLTPRHALGDATARRGGRHGIGAAAEADEVIREVGRVAGGDRTTGVADMAPGAALETGDT